MGNLSSVIASIGSRAEVASTTGSAQAKLTQLLAYIESTAQFEGTPNVLVQYPVASATGVFITGGAPAWTFGAWTEVVAASTLASHVLVGFFYVQWNVNAKFQIDIGEGTAGSEVVKWRTTYTGGNQSAEGYATKWMFPGYRLTANARCAVRAATNNASNAFYIFLYFAGRPL